MYAVLGCSDVPNFFEMYRGWRNMFSFARHVTSLLFHRVPFSLRSTVLDGAERGMVLYVGMRFGGAS